MNMNNYSSSSRRFSPARVIHSCYKVVADWFPHYYKRSRYPRVLVYRRRYPILTPRHLLKTTSLLDHPGYSSRIEKCLDSRKSGSREVMSHSSDDTTQDVAPSPAWLAQQRRGFRRSRLRNPTSIAQPCNREKFSRTTQRFHLVGIPVLQCLGHIPLIVQRPSSRPQIFQSQANAPFVPNRSG